MDRESVKERGRERRRERERERERERVMQMLLLLLLLPLLVLLRLLIWLLLLPLLLESGVARLAIVDVAAPAKKPHLKRSRYRNPCSLAETLHESIAILTLAVE